MNKISPAALLTVTATIITVLATFGVTSTHAATVGASSPAEIRYQQDRADCLAGKTAENQATCLKEAGAALQAAREHDLKSGNTAQLAANERKRCEPLSGDDRKACMARADGMGSTSGSVASGGELHEMVTVEPGVQPAPMQAPNGN
jgi:hypothetical protein